MAFSHDGIELYSNMDSSEVLSSYLLSRSNFEDIVSFDQFKKYFPKGYSQDSIKHIYNNLKLERLEECILPSLDRIKREFEVPLKDIIENMDNSSDLKIQHYSLEGLVGRLEEVKKVYDSQNRLADIKISDSLEEINTLIQALDDTGVDKDLLEHKDFNNLVAQGHKAVQKCEILLEK
ncbi:uncharacterized protein PRCAT00004831001 [Priceomyces carsonii]|uniref:uncharacterized protein n=1 Tax=Priceomyces carsonii TaxID=28549 RepID=UPI002ED99B02|nr:unnamed protein product [Priceomyces carsonii]